MTTKYNGPLLEDYVRALKAAKRMGVKVVRIEIGGSAIALMMDDSYLEKLALGHAPAPDTEVREKPKARW